MIQILTEIPESIARFRCSPWEFQQTFRTPLKELERFVGTLLSGFELKTGSISTHEVVFEPDHILNLFARHLIQIENHWSWTVLAAGPNDIQDLLATTLSDWIDFFFVPDPESFAIYADHDEYCTFYAKDRKTIGQIKSSLIAAGFPAVDDYIRTDREIQRLR